MAKKKTKKKITKKKSAKAKSILSEGDSVKGFKDSYESTGGSISLGSVKSKYIVVYFYPKDSTPGCTNEGKDFSKNIAKFKKLDATIFGVSRDSMKSHEKFKDKYKFKFELISDPDEKLCKKFGVIQKKKLYGREFMGIVRSTFILNAKGKVLASWQGVKVNGHVDEVLETLKSL